MVFTRFIVSLVLAGFGCVALAADSEPGLSHPSRPTTVLAHLASILVGAVTAPTKDEGGEVPEELVGAALDLLETKGTGVKIQGLNDHRTELNGREVFAVPGGHMLSWSDVSREWMAGVEVHKSPDASAIEGAAGGRVDIRTKKPFELKSGYRAFSLESAYRDLADNLDNHAAYLTSYHWDTAMGNFGLLLNGEFANKSRRQDSLRLEPYIRRLDLAAEPVYVPRGVGWQSQTSETQQQTLSMVLQWQPAPGYEFVWQSLNSHYRSLAEDVGASVTDSEVGLIPAAGSQFVYDENGALLEGQLLSQSWRGDLPAGGVRINGSTRGGERLDQSEEHTFAFSVAPTSGWAIKGELQYTRTTTEVVDLTVYTSTYGQEPNANPGVEPEFYLDLTGDRPSFHLGDNPYLAQADHYFWNAAMDHLEDSRGDFGAARLDSVLDIPDSHGLTAWRTGARVSHERYELRDSGYNWGSLSDNWNPPLKYISANRPDLVEFRRLDDFYRSDADVITAFYLPAAQFVMDYDLASEVLPNEIKSGLPDGGWKPEQFSFEDRSTIDRRTAAIYSLLTFQGENGFFTPLSGWLGARYVTIQSEARGYGKYIELTTDKDTIDANALLFADGSFFAINDQSEERKLLPSAYLQMSLAPSVILRMAASKTFARPEAHKMRSYAEIRAETETLSLDNGESEVVVKRWLGKSGSGTLKSVDVVQGDAVLEWQWSDSQAVYAAVFYKDLDKPVIRKIVIDHYLNNGVENAVEVERWVNFGSAYIRGYELGLKQKLGFLPGTLRNAALQLTYTSIASLSSAEAGGRRLPLEGLSDQNISFSGTYQNRLFSTAFNYQWRGDYLQNSVDVNTSRPTWHQGFARLDASIGFRIGKHLQLAIEGQNLTNTEYITALGPATYAGGIVDEQIYENSWRVTDRQLQLTLRGQF